MNTLGVIDWLPEVVVTDGKARFTIEDVGKKELLYHVQGWTDDGALIDEVIKVIVE